jgi:hypothetical protein
MFRPIPATTTRRIRMRIRRFAVLLLTATLLMGACATAKKQERPWQAGDRVICPHCGREFPIPEKLGQ